MTTKFSGFLSGVMTCSEMNCVGFPGGSDGKEYACNAGDPGLIPGSGRSPGEGNGNPLQFFCLENSRNSPKEPGKLNTVTWAFHFFEKDGRR